MDLITSFINVFLHLDEYLNSIIQTYGNLTYLILFVVIFCETGLVVTPFLPGDSLVFGAGALAGAGLLKVQYLYVIMIIAPIFGDTTNYFIGRFVGLKAFQKENSKIFKKEYLTRTEKFYEKYGRKTLIIARFIPIVRTFAPFVAGVSKMPYLKFITYSIFGTFLWITAFLFGGYFFGNMPVVKNNFTLVILAIICISFIPAVITFIREKKQCNSVK